MSIEKPCLDCDATVNFPWPWDDTCANYGLGMYMNEAGQDINSGSAVLFLVYSAAWIAVLDSYQRASATA